ncbi:Rho/RAC guanine nucleotide exchange factor, putative [Entamoeba dispar SAW760]|uniref:Rho/RAC guanine nucleotide exchange factor, putative n=1 Tax=Entamoeba dispar (strain ATCC PRA-260 / SAW760) TaxID=370354 RepID=B0EP22_ENTDS|nr:Rho/RAC guanine nucleotide exchange factor, putative [Entamoeba dispar SAW760]EDR23726.1 Rho/RAC guanine nucleotide exchange factor, putative [Entamoeba dispar SAW760]|eukprot:EDR23726.1 Rho/RAC guanine nucleotide exchange factor, putative [Entamoeba dispar SAW760]
MSEQREKVINEIIDTEVSYLNSLSECRAFYWDDMRLRKPNTMVVPMEKVDEIFIGFEDTIIVSQYFCTLLKDLKKENKHYTNIQDAFIKAAPFFLYMREFIGNNSHALKIVNSYKDNKKVDCYFEQIRQCLPTKPQLDLGSMLIMPVQRTPRYVLLLNEVLKHTDKEKSLETYQNVEKAYNIMKDVASQVNGYIPEFDRIQKLRIVSEYLEPSLRENWYCKGRSVIEMNKDALCGLVYSITTDYIVIGERKAKNITVPVKTISLFKPQIQSTLNFGITITSHDNKKTITLSFASQEEVNQFINKLSNIVIGCTEEIYQTLGKKCCVFCHKANISTKCPVCNKTVCDECKNDKSCYSCQFENIRIEMNKKYLYVPKDPIVIKSFNQLSQSMKEKEMIQDMYAELGVNQPKPTSNEKRVDPFTAFLQGDQKIDTEFFLNFTKQAEEKRKKEEEQKILETLKGNTSTNNNTTVSDNIPPNTQETTLNQQPPSQNINNLNQLPQQPFTVQQQVPGQSFQQQQYQVNYPPNTQTYQQQVQQPYYQQIPQQQYYQQPVQQQYYQQQPQQQYYQQQPQQQYYQQQPQQQYQMGYGPTTQTYQQPPQQQYYQQYQGYDPNSQMYQQMGYPNYPQPNYGYSPYGY